MDTQLIKRFTTAVILLPILIAVLYVGSWWLVGLTVVVFLLLNWEYYSMRSDISLKAKLLAILVNALPIGLTLSVLINSDDIFNITYPNHDIYASECLQLSLILYFFRLIPITGIVVLIWFMRDIFFCRKIIETNCSDVLPAKIRHYVWGYLYMGVLASTFILANSIGKTTGFYLAWILAVVFVSDTCGYFFGKKFGERKFSPNVSPNKTWVGFFAGLVGAALASLFFVWLLIGIGIDAAGPVLLGLSKIQVAAYGVFIGVLAVFGDLFESLVKRLNGVKDSGNLLPGHGGILDRLDGVLWTVWVAFLVILLNS